MNIIYLNGSYLPREKALISVFDRGFLFGDGVYEVIPVFNGHAFLADEHLERLKLSLKAIHLTLSLSLDEWKKACRRLIAMNHLGAASFNLYLQVTRGVDSSRAHAIQEETKPTVMIICIPAHFTSIEEKSKGFKAITLEDTRWTNCYIKSTSLLPSVLLHEEVRKDKVLEAVLHRDGYVTEGTLSNVFIVKNREILTPPKSSYILSGITRDFILKLAAKVGISAKETLISLDALFAADEIWITGSSKEICPIIQLDDQKVGNGNVGPVWQKVVRLYEDYKLTSRQEEQEAFDGVANVL